MKQLHALFLAATATAVLLLSAAPAFAATVITVNSTNHVDASDSEMTLLEAVLYMNQLQGAPAATLGRSLSTAEAAQVSSTAGTNHLIQFNIAGAGPHVIAVNSAVDVDGQGTFWAFPILATNVLVDGYSQPGSSPNTNAILAPNNAALRIVIDGDTNTFRLFGIVADHDWLRGLSIIGGGRAAVFDGEAGAVLGNAVIGGGVQGCWIGVAPDATTVKGQGYAVASWATGGSQVYGTDGDGVNDRNEFNVIVASDEMHIAIGQSDNCRVSGNFINVLPDGLHSSGVAVGEGDGVYLEDGGPNNTIIGTDSNGISDENERNLIGGLNGSDSNCETIAAWSGGTNVTIMGNYFGVGIDGVTPLPNKRGICNDNAGSDNSWLVGANGDGLRDEIEENIIANTTVSRVFKFPSAKTSIVFRRNTFFGNTADFFDGTSGNQNSYNGVILSSGDTATISPVVSNATTRAELIGWVPVSGDPTALNRTNAQIHIYEADPTAAADRPQGKKWLASYADNGPQDLDPATNYFRFRICSLPISSTGASITVNETCGDDVSGGSSRFATAVPLPDVPNALSLSQSGGSVTLSWQMNGRLQARPSLTSGSWTNVPGCSPVVLPATSGSLYFRVAQ